MDAMQKLIDDLTRAGRRTSEFWVSLGAVLLVALDRGVSLYVARLDVAAGDPITSTRYAVAYAAIAGGVAAAYSLGRSYIKGRTAAAATRAIGDVSMAEAANLGARTLDETIKL